MEFKLDGSTIQRLKNSGHFSGGGGGGGSVDTSGTPVVNDIARFVDADTIEGRS